MTVPAYPYWYVGDPIPSTGTGYSWTSSYPASPADTVSVTCEECGMTFSTVSSPLARENAEETCDEWRAEHAKRRHPEASAISRVKARIRELERERGTEASA